jgi:predicted  nucleic acid-binding Zn-ribbon protein
MGGIFGFLKNFGRNKFNQTTESITQKIVAWDPETASQAEIETMIEELDRLTIEAGKAKSHYDREKTESEAAQKNYDRYIAAADVLNGQLGAAQASGDEGKTKEIGASLEKLLHDLEEMKPEVDREAQEAEEAREYYEDLKSLAETAAQKVKTARGQLDKAKRDMKRAEIEQQRANSKAERAEQLAGLKKETSSLGVALNAMNKQAEEARSSAAAAEMKAKLLSPETQAKDSNIEAALKTVTQETKGPDASLSERLAALRRK